MKQKHSYKHKTPHNQKNKGAPKSKSHANIWGVHAVSEAWLNPERQIKALYITEQALRNFDNTLAKSKSLSRPAPTVIDKNEIDRMTNAAVHQGIALDADPVKEHFIQDMVIKAGNQDRTILLMLDQVTDPHNVGAILRSACALGADGLIMQRKHAPELMGVLAKTACGAVEHVPVSYETNLTRTLETLQENGFFAIGLDERGEQPIDKIDVPDKTVLVLGAEGAGLRRLVGETCDTLVRLPTAGPIASLNVSNAAAVALYALKTN